MIDNKYLIDKTVELTVSAINENTISLNETNGKFTADFMQVVFDKLVALSKQDI
ncbi:MAG: hypothetical protein ACLUP2_04550 [Lachnospiraceae bacterium]